MKPDVASYDDAVAAATDPANWDVVQTVEATVSGLQATLVEATSTAAESGTPVGTTLYSYIIDYGDGGTLTIQTSGTAGDAAYDGQTQVADLMAQRLDLHPADPAGSSRLVAGHPTDETHGVAQGAGTMRRCHGVRSSSSSRIPSDRTS